MRIRKAILSDWPRIRRVLLVTKEFSKGDLEDVKHIFRTGEGASFVLLEDDSIIGTISGHWHETRKGRKGREANVEQIAVLPSYQGRGLGHRLLKRIVDFFKSKGDKEVYSRWTKPKNVPFYTKFGFRVVGKDKKTINLVYRIK